MSKYTVSEASLSDLPAFTACQFRAFANGPLHAVIFPNPIDAKERHTKAIVDDGDEVVLLKATDDSTGDIVGGIKWCFYRRGYDYATDNTRPSLESYSTENGAYRQDVLNAIVQKRVEMVTGPHVLLDLLFTDPDHQHQGIGSQLVRWGCGEADRTNMTAIVEASPAGRRMYEKHGFVVHEFSNLKLEQWSDKPLLPQYFMVRQSKPR
ncbi:hypothetical protein LTR86_010789 [Recurvomyces mirabilis]|nr:hypothetical protein LTR86_010789 [Recurvomyces mirabilis]